MPKKDSSTGESIISESGNWNVASDFARIKIMNPMDKCEFYKDLAMFGYESIMEELIYYQIPNDVGRYKGLRRYVEELLKLCKNSKFAMKRAGTKEDLNEYESKLKKIKKVLPSLVDVKNNQISKNTELKIIPNKFDRVLEIVIEIESSIYFPLNQNHLIFTDKPEFDAHAYKKSMKERMTDRG